MELQNKGHAGTRSFVLYREVSLWNLRIKDTLGQGVLSFIERCPLFGVSLIGGSTALHNEKNSSTSHEPRCKISVDQ